MNKKYKHTAKGFTLVEIMIVVVIIGLLAAMAIPAFSKVRASARSKAITNNLRQIASAAQQYMLEQGVSQVNESVLEGTATTNYIRPIQAVIQETYSGLVITGSTTQISTSGADSVTVTFNM